MKTIKKTTLSADGATQLKINYQEYPEYMFAMIAAFLPAEEGSDLRRVAGSVIFKHKDRYGRTYKNGLLHSYNDFPAVVEGKDQQWKEWHKNGVLHREGDFPAFIYGKYEQEWYKNGVLHRDHDRPAVINDELQEWYKNGKRHREGGLPAVICVDTYCEWWVDGKFMSLVGAVREEEN